MFVFHFLSSFNTSTPQALCETNIPFELFTFNKCFSFFLLSWYGISRSLVNLASIFPLCFFGLFALVTDMANPPPTPAKEPSQDPTHPLLLNHSNNPSFVLTQPLHHKNYTISNKPTLVNGSIPLSPPTDLVFAFWTCATNIVIFWLYNFVSENIIVSILFVKSNESWHTFTFIRHLVQR